MSFESVSQRRGFIRSDEFRPKEIYAELDYLHQVINELAFPRGEQIFLDHDADVFSRRVYCMRPGLTIRLPVLKKEDDGWILFVQDRSGQASVTAQTIAAPAGQSIATTAGLVSSVTLGTDYGAKLFQWDFKESKYFEIP